MQETQVQFLGPEDTLEKGLVPHSSMLAWRILMDRVTWRATVHGVTKSDTTELTHTHTHTLSLSVSLSLSRRKENTTREMVSWLVLPLKA